MRTFWTFWSLKKDAETGELAREKTPKRIIQALPTTPFLCASEGQTHNLQQEEGSLPLTTNRGQ